MINGYKNYFLRFAGRLRSWFVKNAGFIFLFFIINYFTQAWSLIREDKIEVMTGYGFLLFFATVILTAALGVFRNQRLIFLIKTGLILICFVPFLVESFVMYNYNALLGIGVINSILETNLKEAKEFISMYVGMREYCIVIFFISAGIFVWKKKLFHFHLTRHQQNRILAVFFTICIVYSVRMLTVYTEFFFSPLLPVHRTFAAVSVAVDNMQAYRKLTEQVNSFVKLTENNSQIKNIVFILGESANRNHMQLYGYYLPNTPYLQELSEKNEICIYRDIISPHSTTVAVLCKLFTFCNYESDKQWYEYSNLIDIMNTAGYRTCWLSNQESSGMWGNVAQIYANHSKTHRFTRIRDSLEDTGILDEEILPLLDEEKNNNKDSLKNFYVLHLMGGHGLYYNRYPYSFHKFTEADIMLKAKPKEKEIVAQYDNTVYYNDYIVKNIIDRFREDEAIVIYLPDHGEAVYDEAGFAGHIEENPNRHMIEIPMVIWASDKFKEKYPDKWQQISNSVDRPYMTDDMLHTILDLLDVKTEDFDASRSIVNDKFDSNRKRIFNGLDYDTQIKTGDIPEEKK